MGCPENEVIGKSLAEFIAKNEQSHFFLAIRELGNPAAFTQHGFPSISTITAVSWVSLEATVICDSEGKAQQLVVTLTDITVQAKRWQRCRLLPHPRKR